MDETKRRVADLDEPYLDLRRLLCPLPVLLTDRHLKESPAGTRVTAIGDDPAIHGDVPAWCDQAGHELVEIEQLADGVIRWVVEKG
jgi:tRNA 2-thiouridine synthesizing protein A